jgi:hypothetical protein
MQQTPEFTGEEKNKRIFQLKLAGLFLLTVIIIVNVFSLDPIAQEMGYRDFADQKDWMIIPNFWNVLTNLGFLIAGTWGIYKSLSQRPISYLALVLSIGVLMTFFGSSYYHWHPSNETLLWDRLPMTIIFMSFFVFIISTYISSRFKILLLLFFLFIGMSSVYYWEYTELHGHGDLRAYVIVQFLPMLLIPIILLLFRNNDLPSKKIITIFLWYILAKGCEHFDEQIFQSSFISGHSLKHLFASVSTYYMIKWTLTENQTTQHLLA